MGVVHCWAYHMIGTLPEKWLCYTKKNGDLNLHLRYIEHIDHMDPYGKK